MTYYSVIQKESSPQHELLARGRVAVRVSGETQLVLVVNHLYDVLSYG